MQNARNVYPYKFVLKHRKELNEFVRLLEDLMLRKLLEFVHRQLKDFSYLF
jgi:hypothetical protein